MTRKEQIREAASKWAGNSAIRQWLITAFETGVNYADKHPINPWISVKGKLPERYLPVIVSFELHNADGTIGHDCCAAFLNINGEWIAFGYNVQNATIYPKVTHWMPIPELPEEGGEE